MPAIWQLPGLTQGGAVRVWNPLVKKQIFLLRNPPKPALFLPARSESDLLKIYPKIRPPIGQRRFGNGFESQ
jgi:hypothetical protein